MKKLMLFGLLVAFMTGCGRGRAGHDGVNGAPGLNGHASLLTMVSGASSCANGGTTILAGLDVNDDYVLEGEEVQQSAQICNGVDGQNGADGQDAPATPFTPVGIVNPCGDAAGIYDEVFIRLSNGTLIASFSDNANGKNTRFSVLTAGNYVTTDGDSCYFSVDSDGNIYNEHN